MMMSKWMKGKVMVEVESKKEKRQVVVVENEGYKLETAVQRAAKRFSERIKYTKQNLFKITFKIKSTKPILPNFLM